MAGRGIGRQDARTTPSGSTTLGLTRGIERSLLAVIEASQDSIGVSDLEGWPMFLNAAGLRLAGLAGLEEMRGHHITEFFPPERRAAVRDELLPRVLARGRQSWELDLHNFRTCERVPVSWDVFRIDDPDTGEPVALATITRDLRERLGDIRVRPTDAGLSVYFADITDRKEAEVMRRHQNRQQAAVAELGLRASRGGDAISLMDEAVAVVSRTLDVELVAVSELSEDGSRLLVRAGAGWDPDVVGVRSGLAGRGSLVGYAVETQSPVVSEDVRREQRCHPSDLIVSHGVASAAAVPIMGHDRPFGAFGVFSRERRRFDVDEVNFLQAIADVLHGAIERVEMARRLDDVHDAERRRLARELHDETLQDLGLALARAANPRGRAGGVDDELVQGLTQVGQQIRAAIYNLRLAASHADPFPTQVGELVGLRRPRLPRADCVVSADVPDRLPQDVASNVLLVLGEALTNVARHAAASRVRVDVDLEGRTLVARVRDDGQGFDGTRPADAAGGHGVPVMRERAEALGGELSVGRGSGGGTLVELRVPLAQRRPAGRTRVLLVDEHAATREAVALAFTQDDEFVVTGQAGSLAEARGLLDGIDLAVLDLQLPDGNGADLIGELRNRDRRVQTLVLTARVDRASVAGAVEKGAAAVLAKTTHLHEVLSAARRMRAGERLMPLEEVVDHLRFAGRRRERELEDQRRSESLSPRELEVLQLLGAGLDTATIAARLCISPRTERNHVANILAKLGVHSQLQAVLFALRHGVLEVPAVLEQP